MQAKFYSVLDTVLGVLLIAGATVALVALWLVPLAASS